jgi:hypothetical protein
MTESEELYHQIADAQPNATKGKMFGALCLKAANGKAGVMYWTDKTPAKKPFMIFKLDKAAEAKAMKLKGAKVFEPADGRAMKGWVQLSFDHAKQFPALTKAAMAFVEKLEK